MAEDRIELTIGRSEDCDIRVQDPYASPRHARLMVYASRQVFLEDLGSTNGVFIRRAGRLIRVRAGIEVLPDDTVRVGRTWLPVLQMLEVAATRGLNDSAAE